MKRIFYLIGIFLSVFIFSNVYADNNTINLSLSCPNSVTPSSTITCKVYADILGSDIEYIQYITITEKNPIMVEGYNINQNAIGMGRKVEIGTITAKTANSTGTGQITITADAKFKDGDPEWKYDVTATQSIKVQSSVNTLKSITINGNSVKNFNKNVTNYNLNTNSKTVTIGAKPTSDKATVTGTGTKNLVCGNNSYTLSVKAQNGNINNYKINVNRKCDNNYLKGINISSGNMIPEFKSNVYNYTVKVDKDIEKISISGVKNTNSQKISGEVSNYPLKNGKNNFALSVTDDGAISKTYNIVVEKNGSSKKLLLSKLSLSSGTIEFDPNVFEYETRVLYDVEKINVLATPQDTTSKVTVEGNENLIVGENIITITLKDDMNNEQVYKVKINRLNEGETLGDNPNIKDITIKGYNLQFNYDKESYKLVIAKEKSLDINVVMDDENATYEIQGNNHLKDGSIIKIVTKSMDGSKTKTYTIEITKPNYTIYYIIGTILISLVVIIPIVLYLRYTRNKKENVDINGYNINNIQEDENARRHIISNGRPVIQNQTIPGNVSNTQINPNQNANMQNGQISQIQNNNNEALEGKTIVFQRPINQNGINNQNQNITNQTLQNNEINNIQNIKGYRCPACGRELLGNPDTCPYCNARLR